MKQVTIITIPLAYYHGELYWCLYDQYRGKVREDLLNRPTGGKQIPYAFEQALKQESDILIIADDKFTFEENQKKDTPSEVLVKDFLLKNPLPGEWLKQLRVQNMLMRIVMPQDRFACTLYTFSEKLLLAASDRELPGECANEWILLLYYLQQEGYKKVLAYIPTACHKGICYGTPYAQENNLWTDPICIKFTDKDNVSFEYEQKQNT